MAYTSYREYINKGYSQNDAVGKSLSELLGGILGGYAATKFLPHPLLKVFGAVIGVYLGSKAGGLLWDKMKNELSNIFNQMDNILNEYDDYYYDGKCNLKPKNPYLDQLLKDFYGMQDKILLSRVIYGDPLVVDVDGDGIEKIGLDNSNAMFDLDGDGFREKTGWVSPDDGILVIDRNGDGQINDVSEVFRNQQIDGFTELSSLTQMVME
ncbi:hypothetical protein [Persephonella sp.]